MPRLLIRRRAAIVAVLLIVAALVVADADPAAAGFGGGYGGTTGSAIWALAWWLGNPQGPGPYTGPTSDAGEQCIWHDAGPSISDLVGQLGGADLPKSFWDAPQGGGHEGIWGVINWAEAAANAGTSGSGGGSSGSSGPAHFDVVGCPQSAQVPSSSPDVEDLPEVRPPKSPPLYLWIFWDTVPDPPAGALPPVIQVAYQELGLPAPTIETSPATVAGVPNSTVVNLPTWLWIDPAAWQTKVASATAGPYTATVWAAPVAVTWSAAWDFPAPGDDPESATSTAPFALDLSCPGPGVAYNSSLPAGAQRSYCTVDFSQPTFGTWRGLTATIDWKIHWALSDASGVVGGEGFLPDGATSSTRPLRVLQVESVISQQ